MTGLEHALMGLRHAVDAPRRHHVWRRLVRHRMGGVRDALAAERSRETDAWLAARESGLDREREGLLARLGELGPQVLDAPDIETVRGQLQELIHDLERYRQRRNDLVYDSVSLELGGSE